ncbi:MAG: hypothetical protein ABI612_04275 [Betaproteobacteria bacterium]
MRDDDRGAQPLAAFDDRLDPSGIQPVRQRDLIQRACASCIQRIDAQPRRAIYLDADRPQDNLRARVGLDQTTFVIEHDQSARTAVADIVCGA